MQKGRLIVIDGSDGSGKATQTKLLVQALKKTDISVRTLDFPQYEKNFFGKFVGECITGDYGDFLMLDPHITSLVYAADRFESSQKIQKWIDDGCTVVLDRYVSANQIHQGGKIFDSRKRKEFLLWLDKMEFGVFQLPRPDIVIYLDVPINMSVKLLQNAQQKKKYIKEGKKDIVEQNYEYLENSRRSALWLARNNKNWIRVQCVKNNELRSIDDIHEEIMTII
ncbi:MAG: thymidylate kinase [Candidatus Moraniibacteriota bacterium]|nr:MAG: thymidylate kinase [Candidatus Moranbacteria bacterium]